MPMPIGHEPVLFSNPNLLETTPDGRYSTFVAEMTPGKVTQEVIDFHTLAQSAFPQMKSWTPEDLVRYPQRIPELMFCIRDGAMMVSAAKVRMFAKFSTVDPLHQPCVLEFNTAATHPDYQARGLMSGLLSNMFRRLPEMIYSLVGKATERTFEAIPNEPYPGLHPFQRKQAILRGLSDAMILVFDTSRVTAKYEYLEMESSRVGAPLRKAILNTATAAGWSPEITVPNTMFKSFAQVALSIQKKGLQQYNFLMEEEQLLVN